MYIYIYIYIHIYIYICISGKRFGELPTLLTRPPIHRPLRVARRACDRPQQQGSRWLSNPIARFDVSAQRRP